MINYYWYDVFEIKYVSHGGIMKKFTAILMTLSVSVMNSYAYASDAVCLAYWKEANKQGIFGGQKQVLACKIKSYSDFLILKTCLSKGCLNNLSTSVYGYKTPAGEYVNLQVEGGNNVNPSVQIIYAKQQPICDQVTTPCDIEIIGTNCRHRSSDAWSKYCCFPTKDAIGYKMKLCPKGSKTPGNGGVNTGTLVTTVAVGGAADIVDGVEKIVDAFDL